MDKNLKLILGLVWTLILHYSISKQNWELPDTQIEVPERTPKQKLMMWIKAKLPPGLPLNNFTSDWNDGVLLGALVSVSDVKSAACVVITISSNVTHPLSCSN